MKTRSKKWDKPFGITYDILHDVRKAMRTLRRIEKYIVSEHRTEANRRKKEYDQCIQSKTTFDKEPNKDILQ